MSIKCAVIGFAAAAVAGGFVSDSFGQRSALRLNQGFRFLGDGYSAGYHWRTPGPIVNYYNPWSYHNTNSRTGIVPQGSQHWLNQCGNHGGAYSSYDRPATCEDYGGYLNDPAPVGYAPSNVIDAEIDADEDESEPAGKSILRDKKEQKPTPATEPSEGPEEIDESTMLVPGDFESEPGRGSRKQYSDRQQPVYRNSSHRK